MFTAVLRPYDVIIIGGGIIGLVTAWNLLKQYPRKSIVIMEKEAAVAAHQSGVRHGLLHSGIYYVPGSQKAVSCMEGRKEMLRFCQDHGIPVKTCGKVIVATSESELPILQETYQRGIRSGIRCELVGPSHLKEIEPHADGLAAIHVKDTAVLDYKRVCEVLSKELAMKGCYVMLNTEVQKIKEMPTETLIVTNHGRHYARYVVNCAGLHADRISIMARKNPNIKIISFRGEFFQLREEVSSFCNAVIYPVPIPNVSPLGPHFVKGIDGTVECGPNAVLAFAREGYSRNIVNPKYLWEVLAFSGFWWLLADQWPTGLAEMWRTNNRNAFVKTLQRLMPEIKTDQLIKAPSTVRAQAVTHEGKLIYDLIIQESHRIVHVLNTQTPSATASFSIGKSIVSKLSKRFQ